VASRTQNPDQADLAALLNDGAVLRTHVLRPTWHFVRAEDIGWLLDLTCPRVRRVTGQQLRDTHGLDERSTGQAVTAVTHVLASRGHLTRGQLADELRERGIRGSGQMLMILLAHAELGGLICSGRVAGHRRRLNRDSGRRKGAPQRHMSAAQIRSKPACGMHGAERLGAASRRFSWGSAIYLTALPGQLELETSSGCAPVNAAAAVVSPRS
jgi:hypothetical protein